MFVKISSDTVVNIDSIKAITIDGNTSTLTVGYCDNGDNIDYVAKGEYADYIRKYFNMALGPEDAK